MMCGTQCTAEYFIRFCFCRWLQNHTRTTFFFRSSFSAMAAIFSEEGRGWMAKYASKERFSGAAMDVRFLFLSFPLKRSGLLLFSRYAASASSSQAWRTGLSAIMLLWDKVRDSNLQMVLWLSDPTPGILRLASADPTSAWVTPSLILLCLKRSANASSSLGSDSTSLTHAMPPCTDREWGWAMVAIAWCSCPMVCRWWWGCWWCAVVVIPGGSGAPIPVTARLVERWSRRSPASRVCPRWWWWWEAMVEGTWEMGTVVEEEEEAEVQGTLLMVW